MRVKQFSSPDTYLFSLIAESFEKNILVFQFGSRTEGNSGRIDELDHFIAKLHFDFALYNL